MRAYFKYFSSMLLVEASVSSCNCRQNILLYSYLLAGFFSQEPSPVIKAVNKFVELISLEDLKFPDNDVRIGCLTS